MYVGQWLDPRYGSGMDEESDTQKLRLEQLARARREERLAEVAEEPEETAQHERRADKASYLREKLEEQEASQRESERDRGS